jgi:hypothetical protein
LENYFKNLLDRLKNEKKFQKRETIGAESSRGTNDRETSNRFPMPRNVEKRDENKKKRKTSNRFPMPRNVEKRDENKKKRKTSNRFPIPRNVEKREMDEKKFFLSNRKYLEKFSKKKIPNSFPYS